MPELTEGIKPEKNKSSYVVVFLIIIIGLCGLYYNHITSKVIVQQHEEALSRGFYLLDKYPFIKVIGFMKNRSVYKTETKWMYSFNKVKNTIIPQNKLGVVTSDNNARILTPGEYRINPDIFDVTIVDLAPQTIYFKGE